MCASSWVSIPVCAVKVLAGNFALATDHSIWRSLRMSIFVRTRKMVNYAGERQTQGETLMEACSDTDVQIVRYTWV